MKTKIIGLLIIVLYQVNYSQEIRLPVESFFTESNYHYQHTFRRNIASSKFTFFNLTSLKTSYSPSETSYTYLFRNQLSYKIHSNISLGLTGELKSSGAAARIGLQYAFKNKEIILSIYPNITIEDKLFFVNMLYFEYKPKINKNINFYSRLQIQTTSFFNRATKYSNLYRIGIEYKTVKFGVGMSWFDPFHSKRTLQNHFGIFMGIIL